MYLWLHDIQGSSPSSDTFGIEILLVFLNRNLLYLETVLSKFTFKVSMPFVISFQLKPLNTKSD